MSDIRDASDEDEDWDDEQDTPENDGAILSSQPQGLSLGAKLVIVLLLIAATSGLWRLGIFGKSAPPPKSMEEAVASLVNAVRSRLRIMPEVAYSKYLKHEAVDDHEQEERVVRAFGKKATEHGLDTALAEEVIRAQIEAAKLVQREAISRWEQEPPPEGKKPMDLVTELRPTVDRHTNALVAAMVSIKTFDGDWRQELRRQARAPDARPEDVPESAWTTAWRPFIGALSTPQASPGKANGVTTSRPADPAPVDQPVSAEVVPE